MSEAIEPPYQETSYFSHNVENLAGLTSLEERITKSLCLDINYGEDEQTLATLNLVVVRDALFLERLERALRPNGFHGAVNDIEALVVPDISPETFAAMYTYKTARMHRATWLSLRAHASSTGLSDAGYFNAEVLYFTRTAPAIGKAALSLSGFESNFPVARKVVSSQWEEGSPFLEKQKRLAKMSNGASTVRRGNGKVRRLPKHR